MAHCPPSAYGRNQSVALIKLVLNGNHLYLTEEQPLSVKQDLNSLNELLYKNSRTSDSGVSVCQQQQMWHH